MSSRNLRENLGANLRRLSTSLLLVSERQYLMVDSDEQKKKVYLVFVRVFSLITNCFPYQSYESYHYNVNGGFQHSNIIIVPWIPSGASSIECCPFIHNAELGRSTDDHRLPKKTHHKSRRLNS